MLLSYFNFSCQIISFARIVLPIKAKNLLTTTDATGWCSRASKSQDIEIPILNLRSKLLGKLMQYNLSINALSMND